MVYRARAGVFGCVSFKTYARTGTPTRGFFDSFVGVKVRARMCVQYNRKGYEMNSNTGDLSPDAAKGCTAYPFAQPRPTKGGQGVVGRDAGITDPADPNVMPRPYASNGGSAEE